MDMTVKRGYLIIEADNVKIEESVTEGIYALNEDSKKDFSKRLGEDVTDEALNLLTLPMEDLFYQRDREYDSSSMIVQAFDKLPENLQDLLLKALTERYGR